MGLSTGEDVERGRAALSAPHAPRHPSRTLRMPSRTPWGKGGTRCRRLSVLLRADRMSLFDEDVDGEFRVNHEYKKEFESGMREQELKKKSVREKLKLMEANKVASPNSGDESESSSDEEEDDDGELLTPGLDLQIHQTLDRIRRKDPQIYCKQAKFYSEPVDDNEAPVVKKERKMTVKEVLTNQMLDENQDSSDEEAAAQVTNVQLQAKAKNAFIEAGFEVDDADEEMFSKKKGAVDDEEYKAFEAQQKRKEVPEKVSLQRLLDDDGELSHEDKFLRDYVLGEWWKEDAKNVPDCGRKLLNLDDEEDEEEVLKADRFEAKYNFRFEEAEGSRLQTHSRNIESIRNKSSKRAEARKRKKERQAAEKEREMQELKRLKNEAKKVMQKKLQLIKEQAGEKKLNIQEEDLEEEFDEEKHNQKMQELFGEEYFNKVDENVEELKKEIRAEREKSQDEHDEQKKNVSELEDGPDTVEGMLDVLYNMDYEDVIGGGEVKTRFRYTTVPKHDYGIPMHEMLNMDDSKLCSMVSLKRLAPYRTDRGLKLTWRQLQERKQERYNRKRQREELDSLKPRAPKPAPVQDNDAKTQQKKTKKKRRQKKKASTE